MKSALIEAIRTGDPEIMQLFAVPFNRKRGWLDYLDEHFHTPSHNGLSISSILDNAGQWHSHRFQALYVACWIYHPLEKGSYMIKLTPAQKANAELSAGQLTWRISSHLSATSRSARGGKDFQFIKGYGELLVIVEGDFLFLKMEGHAATSPSHMQSWITKIRTGEGEIANMHLHRLAKGNNAWGITGRGAENYSKEYKALLKALGLSGKTVVFSQVIAAFRKKYPFIAIPTGGGKQALQTYVQRILVMAGTTAQANVSSQLFQVLTAARPDLMAIIDELAADEHRVAPGGLDQFGIDRVFREVRMSPESVDIGISNFFYALQCPNFDIVCAINGD